jgi:hypothetical protein
VVGIGAGALFVADDGTGMGTSEGDGVNNDDDDAEVVLEEEDEEDEEAGALEEGADALEEEVAGALEAAAGDLEEEVAGAASFSTETARDSSSSSIRLISSFHCLSCPIMMSEFLDQRRRAR